MRLPIIILSAMLLGGTASADETVEPMLLSSQNLPQGVTAPEIIKSSRIIDYVPGAVRAGLTGKVTLELLISESGEVSKAKITKTTGYTWLDQTALQSAKLWKYNPATRNGEKISSRIEVAIDFKSTSDAPDTYLPPSAYTSGLPPNFSPVPAIDSSPLKVGEELLSQGDARIAPFVMVTGTGKLIVPDRGETLHIDYSINPSNARERLLVVTEHQMRDENRGITPTGPYPLDAIVSGKGSQSVSLPRGEFEIFWLFGDAPTDRIVSYREVIKSN